MKPPKCPKCGQEYWPTPETPADQCPGCAGTRSTEPSQNVAPVEGKVWYQTIRESTEDPTWPPFPTMSASSLPPSLAGNALSLQPRSAPDERPRETNDHPVRSFRALEGKEAPQMMFACPACMVMLAVRPGYQLNGDAMNCPHCASSILPPRVFAASPEEPDTPSDEEIVRPTRERASIVFVKNADPR